MGSTAFADGPAERYKLQCFILSGGSFFSHLPQVETLHGKQWPTTGSQHKTDQLIPMVSVSRVDLALRRCYKAGTQKDPGSIPLRLSSLFRSCGL